MSLLTISSPAGLGLGLLMPLLLLSSAWAPDGPEPATMAVQTIEQSQLSGLTERRTYVITDATAWSAFWEAAHEYVVQKPPLPVVDFPREMVIAVSAGEQPSGGFTIAIERVEVTGDALTVTVHETEPDDDCWSSDALTQPYHAVRLPRVPVQHIDFTTRRTRGC